MTRVPLFSPVFASPIAPLFTRYVELKRALGRRFDLPSRTLQSLDRFLFDQNAKYPDLNAFAFQAWCNTHEHVSSGVRRVRMLEIRSFCLYRRRTEPQCFVPDLRAFPPYHQGLKPYIFSEKEVAKLLNAASSLKRNPTSPLRPEVIRLAIILLFTTGIRRGELLDLINGDYNRLESTLLIKETKFYKSRLLPVNSGIADEIDRYLTARSHRKLLTSADTALIWNASYGGRAYSGTCLRLALQPLFKQCSILTSKGKPPRIHDFRHSFAVNALLRWYKAGVNVEAKLPLLATYLGHGSSLSTHYYLHLIEPLRNEASKRFEIHYGELVSPLPQLERRRR
jgi:integrase/recombinase XerD